RAFDRGRHGWGARDAGAVAPRDALRRHHARGALPGGEVRRRVPPISLESEALPMIRKLKSGGYRLYSRKLDPKTGKRRNLGTFRTRGAAEKHERAVQFFKHG